MRTDTPLPLKLLALVGLFVFSMLLFAGISSATGMQTILEEMQSVNAAKFVTFLSQVFSFLLPVVIYVLLFTPHLSSSFYSNESVLDEGEKETESNIKNYFGLQTPKWKNIGISTLVILISIPPIMVIAFLNIQLPLPDIFGDMEEQASGLIKFLLGKEGVFNQITAVIALAIVPGICEEVFFRGTMQNELQRKTDHHIAIWLTAFIFSFIHMQFEGFFPRFLLGALLGYLYVWTKNLWIPVITHAVFNGSQVIASFFIADKIDELENIESLETSSYLFALVCIAIIAYLLHVLYVSTVKKATIFSSSLD